MFIEYVCASQTIQHVSSWQNFGPPILFLAHSGIPSLPQRMRQGSPNSPYSFGAHHAYGHYMWGLQNKDSSTNFRTQWFQHSLATSPRWISLRWHLLCDNLLALCDVWLKIWSLSMANSRWFSFWRWLMIRGHAYGMNHDMSRKPAYHYCCP